ncbi:MAG: ABC transporter ATP-binding protein [Acidimicrobiia bacterium]
MPTDPMITLTDVSKTFQGSEAHAVDGLTMSIAEGESVVLVGPSGCGKTTTLKMINRLIEPTGGVLTVGGTDVQTMEAHDLRRGIGYVIQQIGLFPHKSIADNIATVPRLLGWDKSRVTARVNELADLVDIEQSMLDRYPSELSGGQRQRVGVARALAADPPVLLMDEPFGAVDPIVRARLQQELVDLQSRLKKTIVLVTHDIDEAILLGDRVAILNVGGHLEQYDAPEAILRDPANEFVADFLGTDRGIKRLSLIPISSVTLDQGPVVTPEDTPRRAIEVAGRSNVSWIAVADNDRLLGWAPLDQLEGVATMDRAPLQPFMTSLQVSASLKEALDVVVSSRESVAAVFDGDRYLGMLTADAIGDEIVQ